MGYKQTHRIRPSTYPNLAEERFKLSTNDYLPTPGMFVQMCLYFGLADEKKEAAGELLTAGLEKTLSQCRNLVGTIEKDEDGDYCILSSRESTVTFNMHWLDDSTDGAQFPSYKDLEAKDFKTSELGDLGQWCLQGMDFRERSSDPSPDKSPPVLGLQANFIPGGIALAIHAHHMAMDFGGIASFVHQWADNTRSLACGSPFPELDPLCLDRSRLTSKSNFTEETQVDTAPAPPSGKPQGKPNFFPMSICLFHLTTSQATRLKKLATPEAGPWISSYDAFVAVWWRILTRHRIQAYNVDVSAPAAFSELVNIRNRLSPPLPKRYFGNAILPASFESQPQKLTLQDVSEDAPLSKIAGYIRSITETVDSAYIEKTLDQIARRRKAGGGGLKPKASVLPPFKTTDWRAPSVYAADFGFGKPSGFRHLFGAAPSLTIYPPRQTKVGEEDVFEFAVPIETVALDGFLEDRDVQQWFEFRGFDFKA